MSDTDTIIKTMLESGRLRVDMESGEVFSPRSNTPTKSLGAITRKGYLRTCLNFDGKQFYVMLHRVVCIAAHGMPPKQEMHVNHISGVKTDNRPCNLEWTSHVENMAHSRRIGSHRGVGRRDGIRDSKGDSVRRPPAGCSMACCTMDIRRCAMAEIKERPILFSAPMVRALLDGSKTQTRHIVKPHPSDDAFCLVDWGDGWWPYRSEDGESPNVDNMEYPLNCPYGQPGDRLWVRETFFERDSDGETEVLGNMVTCDVKTISFAADGYSVPPGRKRPAIHLPRWASRILLEITAVRVERLQDISEADANAEGIKNLSLVVEEYGIPGDAHEYLRAGTPQLAYVKLWESINGAGSWAENPLVWVVEFRRIAP